MPKPSTKKRKSGFEDGPIAATIAEIARGPRCSTCGRSTRRGGHDCQGKQT
jgi:hypothetical protein